MDITDNLTLKTFPEIPDNWTLANDAILSRLLQRLSEKLTLRTHDVQTALNNLENNVAAVAVEVCNTNNDLFALSHKQFMENRTYVGGQMPQPRKSSAPEKISMTMANETGIFTACKSALLYGINLSKEGNKSENEFTSRTLTPIIGSDDFLLQRNHCSPNQKSVAKSCSHQSLDPDQSSSALPSATVTPTSVTPVPDNISIHKDDQVFDLFASSPHSSEHIYSDDIKDTPQESILEKDLLFQGVPVPLPINKRTDFEDLDESKTPQTKANLMPSLPAVSAKISNLFDSCSDSDGMFDPVAKPQQKSPLPAVERSNGSKKSEDSQVKKIPAGGISIFPPSTMINAKPVASNSLTSKQNQIEPSILHLPESEDSDTEMFTPIQKAQLPASIVGRKSLFNSSSEEEAYKDISRPQPGHRSRVPTKRKHLPPSKQKSIFSSDESDSDPFSCNLETAPLQIPKSDVINIHNTAIKDSPTLNVAGKELRDNQEHNSPEHISIIQNDCDIFSNSNDGITQKKPNNYSHTSTGSIIKPREEAPAKEDSQDEDIFSAQFHSSYTNLGTGAIYGLNIDPDDAQIPALPTQSVSVSDQYEDIFSPSRYSPPPMNHTTYPYRESISPTLFEPPKRSNSFLGDSPPPMYDSAPSFPAITNPPVTEGGRISPTSSATHDSCEPLPPLTQIIDNYETSSQNYQSKSINSKTTPVSEKEIAPLPIKTKKYDSLISSLESQLSFVSRKESITASLITASSGSTSNVTKRNKRDTEEPVDLAFPPQPKLLASLQKERPKIQQKRRLPSKKIYNQLPNTQDSSLLNEPDIVVSPEPNNSNRSPKSNVSSLDRKANNISIVEGDSPSSIFHPNSKQLKDDQLVTNTGKIQVLPEAAANLINELEKKQALKTDLKRDTYSVVSDASNTSSHSIARTENKNVPSNSSLFDADSADDDWLFSSNNKKSSIEVGPTFKTTSGKGEITKDGSTNHKFNTDANIHRSSEELLKSVPEEKKVWNDDEILNNISSTKLATVEAKAVSSSKSLSAKKTTLFDSSDEDNIFSSIHKMPKNTTSVKEVNLRSRDESKARQVPAKTIPPLEEITVDNNTISDIPPLPNPRVDPSTQEKNEQIKGNVNLKLPRNVTSAVRSNASDLISKDDAARLVKEPKRMNLFNDDSSDEFDLFSQKSKKPQWKGEKSKKSNLTSTAVGDAEQKTGSSITNPLLANINYTGGLGVEAIGIPPKPDILPSNHHENQIPNSSKHRADVAQTSVADIVTLSSSMPKKEPKFNIFGSDSSSDDGIFSSKTNSRLKCASVRGNTKSNQNMSPETEGVSSHTDSGKMSISSSLESYKDVVISSKSTSTATKNIFNSPNDSKSHRSPISDALNQTSNNNPLDFDDNKSAPITERKSSNIKSTIDKTNSNATRSAKLATKKGKDFANLFSDSDDDELFGQKEQNVIAKTTSQSRYKSIFPSSDDDDDLFKPTKKS